MPNLSSIALSLSTAALLAACGGSQPPIGAPGAMPQSRAIATHTERGGSWMLPEAKSGLYVTNFYDTVVYGYRSRNPRNKPPTCTVTGVDDVNDVAIDGKGNLIVPEAATGDVIIFKGPDMCGSRLATISDPYGMPADVASTDAAKGTIVVGNYEPVGSISLCTIAAGCTKNLTKPKMYSVFGVALARNGDCWADSKATPSGGARLIYFRGCSEPGRVARYFLNSWAGGLDIDSSGNLLSLSYGDAKLYVYHGCNPRCSLVSGPFSLQGTSTYGKVNQDSTHFAAADFSYQQVDIYSYTPTSLRYEYSFWNGLDRSGLVDGVAYNPRSKE